MPKAGISRGDFLKGAAAFSLGGWQVMVAPPGWKSPRTPKLVFGVLADTHLRISRTGGYDAKNWPNTYLVAALRHFRNANVDAVVHCGDMADRGVVEEMQFHADAWRTAFPDGCAADGRKVEKLFVNGNHDVEGGDYGTGFRVEQVWPDADERASHLLSTDMAGNWERIWGEKYEPVWHKEVKGYHFFGMSWGADEGELKSLIDSRSAECGLEDGGKPFFFISHDRTHDAFNEGVKNYRNAFGLWGHWHQSAANWNTVQMLAGTIPSVQCPASYPYFNNGEWLGGGDEGISKAPLEGELQGGKWRQGLVVRVYDDMLTIERREFSEGGRLGADWVMPFGKNPHPFSKDELKKAIGEPQFGKNAELKIESVKFESGEDSVKVSIPLADGNPKSRVYAYDVAVQGDEPDGTLYKSVYAAGCNMGIVCAPDKRVTILEIPVSELPSGKTLAITVRPLTSLGTYGRAIAAEFQA